jgi:hypothetical protein
MFSMQHGAVEIAFRGGEENVVECGQAHGGFGLRVNLLV